MQNSLVSKILVSPRASKHLTDTNDLNVEIVHILVEREIKNKKPYFSKVPQESFMQKLCKQEIFSHLLCVFSIDMCKLSLASN